MNTKPLTTLIFDGVRFADHGLEIDVLTELIAYKKILIETAKQIWRRRNPEKERLPRGFESSIQVKLYNLCEGSTAVPLMRAVPEGEQSELDIEDEFDESVRVIETGLKAVVEDRPLPAEFNAVVIGLFEEFGRTLHEDENIVLCRASRSEAAVYNRKIRGELLHYHERTYEDELELVGEVRAADLDGRLFTIRLDDGSHVDGKFEPNQENTIIEALGEHDSCRLKVKGRLKLLYQTGKPIRFEKIGSITIIENADQFVADVRPIWQEIIDIGDQIPADEIAKLPPDASMNFERYLYGGERQG